MKSGLTIILLFFTSSLSGQSIHNIGDSLKNKTTVTDSVNTDTVYTTVDLEPELKVSKSEIKKIIDSNLSWPNPYGPCYSGKVELIFVVDTFGSISHIKVEKSSGFTEFDAEAIKVIKKLDKLYKPARLNGRPVKAYVRWPILFECEE